MQRPTRFEQTLFITSQSYQRKRDDHWPTILRTFDSTCIVHSHYSLKQTVVFARRLYNDHLFCNHVKTHDLLVAICQRTQCRNPSAGQSEPPTFLHPSRRCFAAQTRGDPGRDRWAALAVCRSVQLQDLLASRNNPPGPSTTGDCRRLRHQCRGVWPVPRRPRSWLKDFIKNSEQTVRSLPVFPWAVQFCVCNTREFRYTD